MPLNAVAFAFSYLHHVPAPHRQNHPIETLINFAFAKSGISCADKMKLFVTECGGAAVDVSAASTFYNELASTAARECSYFPGAIELLRNLSRHGAKNYITSAVTQNVLDSWRDSAQGTVSRNYIEEILGSRSGFHKGADHFAYVAEKHPPPVCYIADAPAEIEAAVQQGALFNIVPIGFAFQITRDMILHAVDLVARNVPPEFELDFAVDPKLLHCESHAGVESALRNTGAPYVVSGTFETIFSNLSKLLSTEFGLNL